MISDIEDKELLDQRAKELLPLTGIFGLYHYPRVSKDIYELTAQWSYPKGSMLFKIRCKELREYNVLIYPEQKIIKNSMVIGHDDFKGAYLEFFNSQVEIAKEQGYERIEIKAAYEPTPYPLVVDDKLIDEVTYNGHLVWGKYGYLMSEKFRETTFIPALKRPEGFEDFIHEIFMETPQANEAKEIWDGLGLEWRGVFDLKDNSLSHQLLKGLNGKYAQYPKYTKAFD